MGRATRIFVAIFGGLAALAGIEHGLGELLQGSVRPAGLVIESWPGSAFFRIQSGEPALTVVPDLLAAGVLTIAVSLVLLVWSVGFVQRRHGGLVLIGLSFVLLLVGGGFGPPLLGTLVGLTAVVGGAPGRGRSACRAPGRGRGARAGRRLTPGRAWGWAALWLWSLVACLAAWLFLLPGVPMLSYFWGVESAALVVGAILAAFGLLILTAVLSLTRDAWAAVEADAGTGVEAGAGGRPAPHMHAIHGREERSDGRHDPGRLGDALRLDA
jgi:hypothetical protein